MPGQEERERLAGMTIDELHGLSRLGVRLPVPVKLLLSVLVPVISALLVEQECAVVGQELVVETVAVGPRRYRPSPIATVQVPLAVVTGAITRVAQDLREVVSVSGQNLQVIRDGAATQWMLSGHQDAPVRGAHGRIGDAMVEAHPLLRQAIEVRRDDILVAVTAQHVPGVLVAENKHKVRTLW